MSRAYEMLFWMLCLGLNVFILSNGLYGPIVKVAPVSMPRAITHCKVDDYIATESTVVPPIGVEETVIFEI